MFLKLFEIFSNQKETGASWRLQFFGNLCVAASGESKTVSNILTLRGFALSYFCDSHISFLLLPCALSNFFCCGINMEFFVKNSITGAFGDSANKDVSAVYLPLS